MGDKTKIQWTDATWNPIRGCSIVSAGCENCYAMRQAHRTSGTGGAYAGLTRMTEHGPKWTGEVRTISAKLQEPLRWKRPRLVFVNSMSDLFHESVPDEYIAAVFGVMLHAPQHTFQILTKRAERAFHWFEWISSAEVAAVNLRESHLEGRAVRGTVKLDCDARAGCEIQASRHGVRFKGYKPGTLAKGWPLSNVWLGVSAENQEALDARLPWLLRTPAAIRFLSAEPLLGPLSFRAVPYTGQTELDWVIVGGESGPRARHCDVRNIRPIVNQCRAANVPVFVKQLGRYPVGLRGKETLICHPKGGDPAEWPADLRVREMPRR